MTPANRERLADAILRGCEGTWQCFHSMFRGYGGNPRLYACALGAAELGGFPADRVPSFEANNILRANDEWRWTRERIAAAVRDGSLFDGG